ncbi:hypothetical protein EE612_060207, partial [Oryza sativa]
MFRSDVTNQVHPNRIIDRLDDYPGPVLRLVFVLDVAAKPESVELLVAERARHLRRLLLAFAPLRLLHPNQRICHHTTKSALPKHEPCSLASAARRSHESMSIAAAAAGAHGSWAGRGRPNRRPRKREGGGGG